MHNRQFVIRRSKINVFKIGLVIELEKLSIHDLAVKSMVKPLSNR